MIEQQKVTINGQIAAMGTQVQDGDKVVVNGKLISPPEKEFVYIMLNKPVGITCTTEQKIKDNIIDFVNHPERIFPVGRLDKPSQGLILLTSDGDIVNKIGSEPRFLRRDPLPLSAPVLGAQKLSIDNPPDHSGHMVSLANDIDEVISWWKLDLVVFLVLKRGLFREL